MELVKSVECPWSIYPEKLEEWEQKKALWEASHEKKEVFLVTIKIRVDKWAPPCDGWRDPGREYELLGAEYFNECFPMIDMEEVVEGKSFSGRFPWGCDEEISEFTIILVVKESCGRFESVPPNWELPPPPENPLKMGHHSAIWFLQNLIKSECPTANWEGFFTKIQDVGYQEVVSSVEINDTRLVEGFQWLAKIEGDKVNLYKEPFLKEIDISRVGDSNYEFFGSWGDKGYF